MSELDEWTIALVCTDRGAPDHTEPVVVLEIAFHGALADLTPDAVTMADPHGYLEPRCDTCGRPKRIRHAKLRKLMAALIAQLTEDQHRVVFDVSYLEG